MIIAATGHRPDKLVLDNQGYNGYSSNAEKDLTMLAHDYLKAKDPDTVISGMALGWDTAVARAALRLKLPLIAAIPFEGQDSKWNVFDKARYRGLLQRADEVVMVCEGGYAAWKFQKRNEWMVNNCNHVMALWNGFPGGTRNCLNYAMRRKRTVDNLWKQWAKV